MQSPGGISQACLIFVPCFEQWKIDGSLDAAIPTLDKDKPYLVYCHIDSVAIAGAQKLVDAGFPKVYRLEGNYSTWVEADYPVEK